ncbi:hypothetical protein [Oscillatoria sp. FACHB-1406]|uniref:hypothetical protein n=1 Tax=Oscillatoria sp. FACHB-1406 TaxID=2692846 RepID=UPI001687963C|nr:hypothetical protein [Oscillatoria sp. FACHB-1406]MBD2578134.1 hypothetical protein [Oscillatoria sp. FACHB-1406]
MFKLGLSSVSPPTAFAVLGSVGAHALLGISLPVLPLFSKAPPGPLEVPIVELSPEEMARIPALQSAPPVAFIPPNATQLLPLPPNFQLPSATQRATPAAPTMPATPAIPVTPKVTTRSLLPTRPSSEAPPYQYPTFTRPQRVVTRGRGGLPLTPSVPVGMGSRMGRTVASSEGLARGTRTVGSRTPEFVPNPNANPMGTLRDSLQQSFNQTPAQPLPVLQGREKDHTNPNEIGLVNPANGSQGATPATPAVPLPVLTPERGNLTPLKPSETPNTPGSQPQEARNGSVSPAPASEPPQALPTPRGTETTRTNENRAPLPPSENRVREPLDPPKVTTSSESNDPRNVAPSRQQPETPAPRRQERENLVPRPQEPETPAPRRQERESLVPRRQESRDRDSAENTPPQNSDARSNPPSSQPEVKKDKPVASENNDTAPAE